MQYCAIDLESIPSQSLPEGVRPEFDSAEVKTGNMGLEKAKEKIDNARIDFDEALDKKMSLDPDLCEVVCFVGQPNGEKPHYCDYREREHIIAISWEVIKKHYLDHIPLVTYNGIQSDLPVLWHSAMRYNIPVSAQMYSDLTRKYDNRYHYDLMQILAGWDRTKWKALDFYLKLFEIGDKTGEGSEIYGWWKNHEYEKIREHCENDVKMTAKLFEKLAPYIVKEIA